MPDARVSGGGVEVMWVAPRTGVLVSEAVDNGVFAGSGAKDEDLHTVILVSVASSWAAVHGSS